MGCIIIAMPKIEDSNRLSEMIVNHGLLLDTETCQNGAEVLRVAHERDYGVVICTKSVKDMSCMELAGYLPRYYSIIVLTKDASLDTYMNNMFKIMMPFKPSEIVQTVEMITTGFARQIRKKNNAPLKRSAAEQKLVDDAKSVLMEQKGMTEPEAFRYIQKTSMDTGRSMSESAQMILMLND